jgi:hypothetical protein
MDHLKGASLVQAPALLANIRLGWKSLAGTNALAYCKYSLLMTVKSVIKLAPEVKRRNRFSRWSLEGFKNPPPGVNVIKTFFFICHC